MRALKPGIYSPNPTNPEVLTVLGNHVRVCLAPDVHLEVVLHDKEMCLEIRSSGTQSTELSVQPHVANVISVRPVVWDAKLKCHLPLLAAQRQLARVFDPEERRLRGKKK